MTAQQLIDGAGRLIGVVASGESMTAGESADALTSLNQLLESLSLERFTVFEVSAATYAIAAGKQTFTIGQDPDAGSSPDISASRPMSIEDANFLITAGGSTYRHPLKVLRDVDEIARIRSLGVSARPNKIGLIGGYPFDALVFDSTLDSIYALELWTRKRLTSIAALDTNIRFPLGYERMLRYALAIELAPEFGREVSAVVADRATQAKMQVQSANAPSPVMRTDAAYLGGNRWFDSRSGGY